ncbi:MAG: hypothetical protein H6865_00855 [Rhodospirillales bacterium]|nr:hypothetical protein [Alphaproteobacteria bacterium]MCB9986175.1 hypothetical protein [Rhodospirillales bacterium]USO07268.1 MAG: hypothetical protein H6866_07515 [Rhodospirillales bacterium]
MNKRWLVPLLCLALLMGGCARFPVPGGTESVNGKAFKGADDFRTRIDQLVPGMGESQVFAIIGRNRDSLTRLSRPEVISALYGGSAVQMISGPAERAETRAFVDSLYGYRMNFRNTKKDVGFASPIRMQTHETGYNYSVDMVFQNGVLFENPVLSGGLIDGTSSRTVFDYLNPGMAVDRIP